MRATKALLIETPFFLSHRHSCRRLLDGEYAPFGFITAGYDLFLSLLPGDVIESTSVDELGQLNLQKIRKSSFQEVVGQSSEQEVSSSNEPAKENVTQTS